MPDPAIVDELVFSDIVFLRITDVLQQEIYRLQIHVHVVIYIYGLLKK